MRTGADYLAAAMLAAMLPAGAYAAPAGGQADGQWPCSRPAPAAPDASWLWPGAHYDPAWSKDSDVAALVATVAPRSLPEDQAVARIEAFGQAHHGETARFDRLASGLIDTLRGEQTQIVAGIWRFNHRQAALARRMEAAYAKDSAAGTDQDNDEQLTWDTRTFDDRQRQLPLICRLPGVVGARLESLLTAVQVAGGYLPGGASSWLLYVTDEQAGEVSVIDPGTRREIQRIDIGKRPRGLVASPDHRFLYVAVSGSPIAGPGVDDADLPPADKEADGIAVIDLAQRKVTQILRGVSDPEQIAISHDGNFLYIASEDSGQLIVMTTDGKIVSRLDVGSEPEGVTVSADGRTVLVTSEGGNSVAILHGGPSTFQLDGRIPVGDRPRSTAFLDKDHAVVPGEQDGTLRLLDLAAVKSLTTIHLGRDDRPMAVLSVGKNNVLVTTGRGGNLLRVDVSPQAGQSAITALQVGERPWGLTLSPDGTQAFTANGPGNNVSIIDSKAMRLLGKVPVAGSPWGILAVEKIP